MTIYYFSGTGNSLDISKKIASEFSGCTVLPVSREMGADKAIKDSEIGFVFPVFAYGPPRMIRDFILSKRFTRDQYVFAVANCGGTPGDTLGITSKLVKKNGGRLSAGFIVKAQSHPMNNNGMTGIIKFMYDISGKKPFGTFDDRKEEILSVVRGHSRNRFDRSSFAANVMGTMISSMAMKMLSKTAAQFHTDGNCTSCGSCVKICPRGNISLVEKRPVWGDDCEACNACIQWCPSMAIHMGNVSAPGMRSHNANVSIGEMYC